MLWQLDDFNVSTDKTKKEIKKTKATLLVNERNMGAGFVLRRGIIMLLKKI